MHRGTGVSDNINEWASNFYPSATGSFAVDLPKRGNTVLRLESISARCN